MILNLFLKSNGVKDKSKKNSFLISSDKKFLKSREISKISRIRLYLEELVKKEEEIGLENNPQMIAT